MKHFAHIVATGRCIPEKIITNAEIDELAGEDAGTKLGEETGIRERHAMEPDQATSDLIVTASHQALQRAGLLPEELDMIIVATDTPDYLSPATASAVQSKLSAKNAGAFDINSAGAGWVTAIDIAGRYIATEPAFKHILVAGGSGMSKFIDWKDVHTCALFGDGAACAVVSAADAAGYCAGSYVADGSYHDVMGIYTGGTFRPAEPDIIRLHGKPHMEIKKKLPVEAEKETWIGLIRSVLAKASLTPEDIGLCLFPQKNLHEIEDTMDMLRLPMSKTHWILDKWGDIGTAGIPAALDDVIENGRDPKPGEVVVFCASGGGMAAACSVWKW